LTAAIDNPTAGDDCGTGKMGQHPTPGAVLIRTLALTD
jgi:hypothetical protein